MNVNYGASIHPAVLRMQSQSDMIRPQRYNVEQLVAKSLSRAGVHLTAAAITVHPAIMRMQAPGSFVGHSGQGRYQWTARTAVTSSILIASIATCGYYVAANSVIHIRFSDSAMSAITGSFQVGQATQERTQRAERVAEQDAADAARRQAEQVVALDALDDQLDNIENEIVVLVPEEGEAHLESNVKAKIAAARTLVASQDVTKATAATQVAEDALEALRQSSAARASRMEAEDRAARDASTGSTTGQPPPSTVEVIDTQEMWTTATLNIRTGPGTEHAKVGAFPAGEKIQVAVRVGDWYQLTDGRFVSGLYLTEAAPSTNYATPVTTPAEQEETAQPAPTTTYYRTSFAELDQIAREVAEAQGLGVKWVTMTSQGTSGYIHTSGGYTEWSLAGAWASDMGSIQLSFGGDDPGVIAVTSKAFVDNLRWHVRQTARHEVAHELVHRATQGAAFSLPDYEQVVDAFAVLFLQMDKAAADNGQYKPGPEHYIMARRIRETGTWW